MSIPAHSFSWRFTSRWRTCARHKTRSLLTCARVPILRPQLETIALLVLPLMLWVRRVASETSKQVSKQQSFLFASGKGRRRRRYEEDTVSQIQLFLGLAVYSVLDATFLTNLESPPVLKSLNPKHISHIYVDDARNFLSA